MYLKILTKIILLFLIVAICNCDDGDDDDDNDDNDDSADDDSADDDEYLPEINENWSYDVIDEWATDFSLDIDLDNNIFLSYYWPHREDGENSLLLARKNSHWETQTISNSVGLWDIPLPILSMAVGSDEDIYLLYVVEIDHASSDYQLYYSAYYDNQWHSTLISDTIDRLPGPSLAIDEDENVHISYYEGAVKNRDLVYVNNNMGSWEYETVESEAGKITTYHDSVIVARDSEIYLAYLQTNTNDTDTNLIYAMKSGETDWSMEIIATEVENISMDVDPFGYAHVGSKIINGDLIYLTNSTGTWLSEKIAEEYINWGQNLSVDDNQVVHLIHSGDSFYEDAAGTFYMNNMADEWLSEEIVNEPNSIISIGLDHTEQIHVALNLGTYLCHLTREIPQE